MVNSRSGRVPLLGYDAAKQDLLTDPMNTMVDKDPEISFVDGLPLASQVKSLYQVMRYDFENARQTQDNFSRTCLIIAQCRSAVELAKGDITAAHETQQICFRQLWKMIVAFFNGVPVIGHLIGLKHHFSHNYTARDKAWKSATRSLGTIAGGVAGVILLGPLGAMGGAVIGGIVIDGITIGIEYMLKREYLPSGLIGSLSDIYKYRKDPGAQFDAIVTCVTVVGCDVLFALGPAMVASAFNAHVVTMEWSTIAAEILKDGANTALIASAAVAVPYAAACRDNARSIRPPKGCLQPPCVICEERERTVLFVPCSHYITCQECAERIPLGSACPMCRAPIQFKIDKVYYN